MMNEEKYKILWDLEQIKNMLVSKELQSKRTRTKLVRLLCDVHFFKSDVGEYFLEFLLSKRFCVDDRKTLLKECKYFEEILQLCEEESVERIVKHQHNISMTQYSVFGQRIGACIYKYLEGEANKLYRRRKREQQRDKVAIHIINLKFDITKEKDADKPELFTTMW